MLLAYVFTVLHLPPPLCRMQCLLVNSITHLVFTETLDVTLFPVFVLSLRCFAHSITDRSYGESSAFSSRVRQDVPSRFV